MSSRGGDDQGSNESQPAIELDVDDSAVTELPIAGGKRFARDRTRPAPTLPPRNVDLDASTGGISQSMAARPSFFSLSRAGGRALGRFPGLVGSIYLVQLGISTAAAAVMAALLMPDLARRPLFDQGMDGDLIALGQSFQERPGLVVGLVLIGLGGIALYWLVSLFLTGGLIAVLLDPPGRRREVARWFGAGGAANFIPLLRLAFWSAPLHIAAALPLVMGAPRLIGTATRAVALSELAAPLAQTAGVSLLCYWFVGTAVDYARVDLVRHPGMSTWRALARGIRLLWARPLALAHTLLYGLFFAAVTAGYAAVSGSLTESLLLAVLLRQLAALLRFLAHVSLVAGQVELACAAMADFLGRRRGTG